MENIPTAVVDFFFFFPLLFVLLRPLFPFEEKKNGRGDRVSFRNDYRIDGFVERLDLDNWLVERLVGYSWW